MKKWVILDRDGVINQDSDDYIKSPEEWIPIPGSLEALALLHQADFKVVVATNQSGLARGLYDEAMLFRIHQKMRDAVRAQGGQIEAIFFCPHGPEENCSCRKPKPGLLEQIAKTYSLSLDGIPFVGDSMGDILAAQAIGATPILVLSGNGQKTQQQLTEKLNQVTCYDDLLAFAKAWIK